jgi:ribose transport system permease protein
MTETMSADSVLSFVRRHRSELLLVVCFIVLIWVGFENVVGFTSSNSVKSILLLSAFLGIAALGQTLVSLAGGIDISIPFVITFADIVLAKLLAFGWSPVVAILFILVVATLIGLLNGWLSWVLGVHPLLVTLGVGFAVLGGAEIFFANAQATVPSWLVELSSAGSDTLGIGLPPVVFIWAILAIVAIVILRFGVYGRYLYASGDNPTAADRMQARRRATWTGSFAVSGAMAAVAGILLLGFGSAGNVSVGEPYMLTTIAAVVVGGTTLLGGVGGYGRTVAGVLLLGVLNTLLVGLGVDPKLQQAVLGLIILAMVSLYAREEHPRYRL